METNHYLTVLRRRWLTMLVVLAVAVAGSWALTARATPKYTATATVFFSVSHAENVSELNQGATFTENLMQSYVGVATSRLVLEPVITQLGLKESPTRLAHSISVNSPVGTALLTVAATTTSSASAADIANAVANQLTGAVSQLSPTAAGGDKQVSATTITSATPPSSPSSPRLSRNLMAGVGAGLLLGFVIALCQQAFAARPGKRRRGLAAPQIEELEALEPVAAAASHIRD